METDILTKYQENRILKEIQHHLREAYSLAICSNGPYRNCDYHTKVWKTFNRFAKKVMLGKIK